MINCRVRSFDFFRRVATMRDPLMWSFPIGRLFGVSVRVHILFPIVCLCLILRVLLQDDPACRPAPGSTWRWCWGFCSSPCCCMNWAIASPPSELGGDADEIFLWPLGGLTPCDVPHNPRAHLFTAAGGPDSSICLFAWMRLGPGLSTGRLLSADLESSLETSARRRRSTLA